MDEELINIEEEFLASWDNAEAYYREHPEDEKGTLSLIREMRQLGYDQWFLAGGIFSFLILFRSKEYDLGAPSISFVTDNSNTMLIAANITGKAYNLWDLP